MKRASLTTAVLLLLLGAGCRRPATEAVAATTDTAATSTTATTAPSAAASGMTKVKVNFYGTISHLLGGTPRRSVLLRGDHKGLMEVSTKDITKKDLETVFGTANVQCIANDTRCTVPLENTLIQFLSTGTLIAQPTTVTGDGSFDDLVPHLKEVTGKKLTDIDPAALAAVTKDNLLISAAIDLPAGEFSATAYNSTAKFDHDHEKKGRRAFGREIILTSTIDSPSLQVTIGGATPKTLPVQDSNGLELRIVNAPTGTTVTEHWDMHYEIAKSKLKKGDKNERPEIVDTIKHYPPQISAPLIIAARHDHKPKSEREGGNVLLPFVEVAGCSNSQWP